MAIVLGQIQSALCQKAPTLQVSRVGTNGQLTLVASGEAGTNYALEASVDLKSWWKTASGLATNGQVGFTYAAAPDMVPRFFRARVNVPLPPLNVGVQPDTNSFTLGVVAPGTGTVLSLYDQNLVHYLLTIPTNAVDQPLVVQMTLVTNLDGLPFSAGLLAAVSLSPPAQFLLAPATLEIDFPTNRVSDPSLVTAFAFDADGSYLRLAPGLPDTNSITLQFHTLAGFGCSVATSIEVAQLAQRPVASVVTVSNAAVMVRPISQSRRPKGAYYATRLDDCFPDKLARAKLIDRYLNSTLATLGAELEAQAVSTKKSNPSLGPYPQDWGSSGVHWPGNQDYIYSDFYYENIDPYLAEAAGNCALTEVLDYRIRELVEIANTFGGSATATVGSRLTLCTGYHDCIKEIVDCCNTAGLGGEDTILDAQVFAGKAAAIGCTIDSSEIDMVSKACLPTWSGSIFILNLVSNYSSISDGTLTSESKEVESAFIHLRTDSVGLSGNSAGSGMYYLGGNLQGNAAIEYTFDFHSVDTSCCSGCTTDEHVQGGTTANGTAVGGFTFSLTNSSPPPIPIPLWNTVIPNNDMILAANQCQYAGSEVSRSSGFVTDPNGGPDPVCTAFAPVVGEISGNSGFANLLPYEVLNTGIQGTVVKYNGFYQTNTVSTNNATITTKYTGASWVFTHN